MVGAGERLRTANNDLWPVRVGLLRPGPLSERSEETLDEVRRASVRALGAPPGAFLVAGLGDPAERTSGYRDVAQPTPVTITLLAGLRPVDAASLVRLERSVAGLAVAGVVVAAALPELALIGGGVLTAMATTLALSLRAIRGIPRVGPRSVFIALASGRVRMAHRTIRTSDEVTIRASGAWITVQDGEVVVLAWACGSEASARWLSDVLRIALSP